VSETDGGSAKDSLLAVAKSGEFAPACHGISEVPPEDESSAATQEFVLPALLLDVESPPSKSTALPLEEPVDGRQAGTALLLHGVEVSPETHCRRIGRHRPALRCF